MARHVKVLKIDDATEWSNLVESSVSKIVVIDCHQEWCGPCEGLFIINLKIFIRIFIS
jgi:thiol-disulfide isomerase/thioredoxin